MPKTHVYYVSIANKKISDKPIEGEETLDIVATQEDVEKIKSYMNKNNDHVVGERYEEDLKTLFLLMYDLGTENTRKLLSKMIK